jgi:hypothetical protein
MTGAETLAYIKRILKRTDKDTEIYEALTDIIADIRIQLRTEDYKEEAYIAGISTLGEYKITLPSDFGHLIGRVTLVDDVNNQTRTLHKISKDTYDQKYGDRLYTNTDHVFDGIPCEFCIYAGQLFLGPVPDLTTYKYYINYTTEDFAVITAATDPVPFTDKYRRTLRAGVLSDVFEGLEFFDEASYWRGAYNEGLIKLQRNDAENISSLEGVRYNGV